LRTLVESMRDLEVWQALGATHVTVNTMGAASRSRSTLTSSSSSRKWSTQRPTLAAFD
jgi:hypothetical protein